MYFINQSTMITVISCCLLILNCLLQSISSSDVDVMSDEFILLINMKNITWKAGRNFHKLTPLNYTIALMGVFEDYKRHKLPRKLQMSHPAPKDLPENFDSRIQWPYCPTIREIRDQGACGSCWAMAAVEAMSDRYCIHSKGKINVRLSVENILSCCRTCGDGCNNGYPALAWKYWVDEGIVSGGPYNSSQGCQPYEIPSCEHHMHGLRPDCSIISKTPKCATTCEKGYPVSYTKDLHYGSKVYRMEGEKEIMEEIYQNGPVQAAMAMYDDFVHYKSGVYSHIDGQRLGEHAVKLIGWGTDNETNTAYWLVANSFNYDWGDNGYFKIKRGTDECAIETQVMAGLPKL